MKKLMALIIVLLAIALPSCQMQDAADLEPIVAKAPISVELDGGATETEGEEDPTSSGTGSGG
ncbi:MAG: hypothetical protein Roseis2KO_37710 [Roseivirga sp.]